MAMFDDVDKKLSGWFNAGAEKQRECQKHFGFPMQSGKKKRSRPSCIGRWENIFMIILQLQRKEK